MMTWNDFYVYPKLDLGLFCLLALAVLFTVLVNTVYVYKRLQTRKVRCGFVIGLNVLLAVVFLSLFLQFVVKHQSNNTLHIVSSEISNINQRLGDTEHIIDYPVSIAEVAQHLPNYNELVLHGDGFSEYQWQQLHALGRSNDEALSTLSIRAGQGAPTQFGFTSAKWQRQIIIGESLDIALRLSEQQNPQSIFEIRLYDPTNTLIDTKKARAGEHLQFSTIPPAQGQWLYRVAIVDNNDLELVSEKISVEVRSGTQTQVLIVQSAPSFETRHLQNWLSNQGSQVRVVTQISQAKFKQQALNIAAEQAALWDAMAWEQSLAWADLLIVDYRFLLQLSAQQKARIMQAIELGLGVYVLADSQFLQATHPDFITQIMGQLKLISSEQDAALFSWNSETSKEPIAALGARFENNTELLVQDENQQGLVGFAGYGQGKLAIALSQNTYQWRISGDRQLHSQYWQMIIKKLGRASQKVNWQLASQNLLHARQNSFNLCADNLSQTQRIVLTTPKNLLYELKHHKHALYENRRCVAIIPDTKGWYQLKTELVDEPNTSITKSAFYLDGNETWQAFNQYEKRLASAKQIQHHQAKNSLTQWRPIPSWITLGIFVFLAALLWSEQRWFSNF